TLTTLDMTSNTIGDLGAQHLSGALKNNTTLTKLNLRLNNIEHLGAQYLSDALRNNNVRLILLNCFI
ncbi:unnamed protein product, partial [Rotaria socialis]